MAHGKRKRHSAAAQAQRPPPSRAGITHDWEKDDEELELEEKLFGRSAQRAKADGSGAKSSVGAAKVEPADEGFGAVGDDDVSGPPGLGERRS